MPIIYQNVYGITCAFEFARIASGVSITGTSLAQVFPKIMLIIYQNVYGITCAFEFARIVSGVSITGTQFSIAHVH